MFTIFINIVGYIGLSAIAYWWVSMFIFRSTKRNIATAKKYITELQKYFNVIGTYPPDWETACKVYEEIVGLEEKTAHYPFAAPLICRKSRILVEKIFDIGCNYPVEVFVFKIRLRNLAKYEKAKKNKFRKLFGLLK